MEASYWRGIAPARCDLPMCHEPITVEFTDGVTTLSSQWAFMCPTCAKRYGKGLGPGLGQRYVRQEDHRFVKVEG